MLVYEITVWKIILLCTYLAVELACTEVGYRACNAAPLEDS
jgi:hypothetical protein